VSIESIATCLHILSTFYFQQFSVRQQHSAMKVCTDATLFGAMAPVAGGETVLDIGAGTGLLSLMAAQLGAGQVTAVELTEAAFREAGFNAENSPWGKHIQVLHDDIRCYAMNTRDRFDLIICNPPFFDQHSKSSDSLKQLARHTDKLPFGELLAGVDRLLMDKGLFYVLLPSHVVDGFIQKAADSGLFLRRRVNIRGYSRNPSKVTTLLFSRTEGRAAEKELTIYAGDRVYSTESERYLSPFLLRFSSAK
jgi:tRNA1Val (adenine37-N6)-methyltransferase